MPFFAEENAEQNAQDGPFGKVFATGLMPNIQHDNRYIMNRTRPARTRKESIDSMMFPDCSFR
jgi:hypothetical protein